jgi:hypothetical protein
MINSLPQLCSEPAVRAWQQQATAGRRDAAEKMPSIPSQVNTLGNATVQDRLSTAQQGNSRPLTAAVDDEHCAATQKKSRPSMMRVGDTRLEVLLSGSLEARVGLSS